MRRSLGKFPKPTICNAQTLLLSSSFSTGGGGGGGGGGGRGRGRGSSSSDLDNNFQFGVSSSNPGSSDDSNNFQSGMGHGRGKPLPSSPPNPPSFSSSTTTTTILLSGSAISTSTITDNDNNDNNNNNNNNNNSGRGRGRGGGGGTILGVPQSESGPKKPIFFLKEDDSAPKAPIGGRIEESSSSTSNLPSSILKVLSGAGRGKPSSAAPAPAGDKVKEENRHLRARQPERSVPGRERGESPAAGRLSPEEARKKAMGILSRGGAVGVGQGLVDEDVRDRGEVGGGFRGRGSTRGGGGGGGRGRGGRGMQSWRGGRGRGRGRGGRGRGGDRRGGQDTEDDYGTGLYLGDDADGEKLATRIGPENMNKLVQGFEEMSGSVLPSPMEDALVDALHTNYMIECEPEYLMEEFGTNPDIDEKPPIPLRDALEKMKPFLMAYEGIQSHQEWEEVMQETMEKVPLLKELVDYYSGPDRVTAKRQQEELERVAKTLPDSAPTSVKRFTDRAVLSLQSNPGWGFDKKCQFMDKLVWEVSQHYK